MNDKTPRALGCGEEPDELNLGVAVEFFFGRLNCPPVSSGLTPIKLNV